MSFIAVGVLALLLRWAFSRGHSLVMKPARRGGEDEYGLLVAISAPSNFIEAEIQRQRLNEAGIKASLTTTLDGPRLMVFPKDKLRALRILSG